MKDNQKKKQEVKVIVISEGFAKKVWRDGQLQYEDQGQQLTDDKD